MPFLVLWLSCRALWFSCNVSYGCLAISLSCLLSLHPHTHKSLHSMMQRTVNNLDEVNRYQASYGSGERLMLEVCRIFICLPVYLPCFVIVLPMTCLGPYAFPSFFPIPFVGMARTEYYSGLSSSPAKETAAVPCHMNSSPGERILIVGRLALVSIGVHCATYPVHSTLVALCNNIIYTVSIYTPSRVQSATNAVYIYRDGIYRDGVYISRRCIYTV